MIFCTQQPTTAWVDKCSKSVVPPAPGLVMTPTLSVLMNVSLVVSALVPLHCGRMDSVLLRHIALVLMFNISSKVI